MTAFMVFVRGKGAPKFIYPTLTKAHVKALRMAVKYTDDEILILKVLLQFNGKNIALGMREEDEDDV
jgi:hypothetical protein